MNTQTHARTHTHTHTHTRTHTQVQYFVQDPSWRALDSSVHPGNLCRLLSPVGCALLSSREAAQRRYLSEGASVGVAAGMSRLPLNDSLAAPVPPSLFSDMARERKAAAWLHPDTLGDVAVRDLADGTFAVDYTVFQPGLLQLVIHGVGRDVTPAGGPALDSGGEFLAFDEVVLEYRV